MVYRLDLSADENSKTYLIKTAIKIKLIFAQLITHYLEGTDIVMLVLCRVLNHSNFLEELDWIPTK